MKAPLCPYCYDGIIVRDSAGVFICRNGKCMREVIIEDWKN